MLVGEGKMHRSTLLAVLMALSTIGCIGAAVSGYLLWHELPSVRASIQKPQQIKVVDISHLMRQLESWGLPQVDKLMYLDLFIAIAKAENTLVLNGAGTLVVPVGMLVTAYPTLKQLQVMAAAHGIEPNQEDIQASMDAGGKARIELDALLGAQP